MINDCANLPVGYVGGVMLSRDASGRFCAEWPNDNSIGTLISRDTLEQLIKECNTSKWISVRDQLPEFADILPGGEMFSRPVLVATEASDDVLIGTYGDRIGWMVDSNCMNTTVTHWMKLPRPPAT